MNEQKENPEGPSVITGETCAFCHEKTLTLSEAERDIPYFGQVFIFSMDCSNCNYHKADVECAEDHGPVKYTLEIDSEEDMKIRIVKSSNATIKIAHVGSIEPGEAANGYVTNVEGVLNRMKKQVETLRDEAEDKADQKKAKNIIKKLTKVMWGQEKIKITLDDPTGNSAIISDKAVKGK
ncbi:ZPR1 zinc finger domain-containing protein [Bacteroidota bacterium]